MKNIVILAAFITFVHISYATERKTIEKHVNVMIAQRVEIEGISGSNIELKSWDKNEVYIKLDVEISSSDRDYEKDYINSVQISELQRGSAVTLRFEDMKTEDKGWSFLFNLFKRFYISKNITGEIYIPKTNPLSTDMRYGRISLDGMNGSVRLNGTSNTLKIFNCLSLEEIQNNYGTTVIENCGGTLQLEGRSSTIDIYDFKGNLNIDANYSEVTLSRITDKIRVIDKSGTIEITDANSDVRVDADYSAITINNVEGFVDVKSRSAKIRAKKVNGIQVTANYSEVNIAGVSGISGKPIVITGQSGNLTLYDATGDVEINNPYSDIELRGIEGSIDITSKSADITAEDIRGDWKSQTEYASVKVTRLAAGSLYLRNKSNPITVHLVSVPSRIDIDNQYGDVTLRMPAGFSGNVEIDAEYGSINTNLSVKRKSHGNSSMATGTIGSGSGSILIQAKSGEIELIEE